MQGWACNGHTPHATMSDLSSPELTSAADQSKWFASEVHAHRTQLTSYLRGTFPSIRDVDDVVQESYVRVWRRHLLQPLACARGFLYKVARNVAIDALRRQTGSPIETLPDLASLNVASHQASPVESACTHDEMELFLEAIETLPPRCREVVILRKLHGLSPQEIAMRLGISEGTVHVHGAKGVRRCGEFLRQRGLE